MFQLSSYQLVKNQQIHFDNDDDDFGYGDYHQFYKSNLQMNSFDSLICKN